MFFSWFFSLLLALPPKPVTSNINYADVKSMTSWAVAPNASQINFTKTTAFTLAAWVKVAGVTPSFYVLGSGSNQGGITELYNNTSTANNLVPGLALQNTAATQTMFKYKSTAITDQAWHRIVATYDGSNNKSGILIYVDGSSVTLSDGSNVSTISTGDLPQTCGFWIGSLTNNTIAGGCANTNSIHPFNGKIDMAVAWNTALTGSQVTEDYNSGNPSDPRLGTASANLVAFYPIGEGSDTTSTLIDLKNSNNATGSGSVAFSTDIP